MTDETYFPWQILHLWPAPTHICFVSYLRKFELTLPAQEASPAESEVYFQNTHETCSMIASQIITLQNNRLLRLSDFSLWESAGHLSLKYLANALQIDVKVFILATLLIYLCSRGHVMMTSKTNCCMLFFLNIKLDISCSMKFKKIQIPFSLS